MVLATADEDVAEVVRSERLLLDPTVRAVPGRVRELLHRDFVEHGASGVVWDREAVTAALADAPDVVGEAVDFAPVPLAQDVVLLTYRITGAAGSLRSSVWVREPVGWRLRFHQGTRSAAEPEPRER